MKASLRRFRHWLAGPGCRLASRYRKRWRQHGRDWLFGRAGSIASYNLPGLPDTQAQPDSRRYRKKAIGHDERLRLDNSRRRRPGHRYDHL